MSDTDTGYVIGHDEGLSSRQWWVRTVRTALENTGRKDYTDREFERFFRRVYQHYGSLEGYQKLDDAVPFLEWVGYMPPVMISGPETGLIPSGLATGKGLALGVTTNTPVRTMETVLPMCAELSSRISFCFSPPLPGHSFQHLRFFPRDELVCVQEWVPQLLQVVYVQSGRCLSLSPYWEEGPLRYPQQLDFSGSDVGAEKPQPEIFQAVARTDRGVWYQRAWEEAQFWVPGQAPKRLRCEIKSKKNSRDSARGRQLGGGSVRGQSVRVLASPLSAYAAPMPCPVLTSAMPPLSACATLRTGIGHATSVFAIFLRERYAMSGTDKTNSAPRFQSMLLDRSDNPRVTVYQVRYAPTRDWLEAPDYEGKSEQDILDSTVKSLAAVSTKFEAATVA
eukprot:2536684-Rhodomonas_salina.2